MGRAVSFLSRIITFVAMCLAFASNRDAPEITTYRHAHVSQQAICARDKPISFFGSSRLAAFYPGRWPSKVVIAAVYCASQKFSFLAFYPQRCNNCNERTPERQRKIHEKKKKRARAIKDYSLLSFSRIIAKCIIRYVSRINIIFN